MTESVKTRIAATALDGRSKENVRVVLAAMQVDIAALQATVSDLVDNLTAIVDKLDADGGVTDTDYGDEVTAVAPTATISA